MLCAGCGFVDEGNITLSAAIVIHSLSHFFALSKIF